MKFVLALVLAGLATSSAYAQRNDRGRGGEDRGRVGDQRDPLSDQADRVAYRLRRDSFRLSDVEKRNIASHLATIEDILRGPVRPPVEMACVPRDNDGMAPYVLAFRNDPITYNRISNAVYSSQRDCERAFQQTFELDYNTALLCVTRDRDGQAPWSLAILNAGEQTARQITLQTSRTLDDCVRQVRESRDYGATGLGFCAARDNDNAAPWVIRILRRDGTIQSGDQTFSTYEACMRSL